MEVTRLKFLLDSVAFATLAGCVGHLTDLGDYEVAVLGDTHFDVAPESVYHSHYDESNRHAKVQHEEFKRNGRMWSGRCKRLLESSGELAKRYPTDFVLQLGDLIQGDCDDVPTHQKMMSDCLTYMRSTYSKGIPFLTVLGNHDVRGKGARGAYLDFVEPYLTREMRLNTPAKYPAFAWRKGKDLWIFCDFDMQSLSPIIDLIKEDHNSRYLFLVTHGPFTPTESSSPAWRLGGSAGCDKTRMELYELLSRKHAIVISGHTHRTTFYRHENKYGAFTEFTANSVWARPELGTAQAKAEGVADYGKYARGLLSAEKYSQFVKMAEIFKSGLKEYYMSEGAGHFRLKVSDRRVAMEFYPGAEISPARVFELKTI